VGTVGAVLRTAMDDAAVSVTAVVAVVGGGVAVVVVTSTGEPSRSGTRGCEAPDAGGGIGAVLFGFVVDVVGAGFAVVVVTARVVVVVTDTIVVVVEDGSGAVVVVSSGPSAITPAALVARQNATAPIQTQRLRRTPSC
jgi:hypothetical protein